MANVTVANSTFLDFTSYRSTTATTPEAAYGITPGEIEHTGSGINVALVLDRATDPTALLNSDWATRQKILADMNADGTLWSTYGANETHYNQVVTDLTNRGFTLLGDAQGVTGYVSSAASRTIWLSLDNATFHDLFGTDLLRTGPADDADLLFWNGSLSLPEEWGVKGLWFDFNAAPAASDLSGGASVTLPQGPQSPGNNSTVRPDQFPFEIGRNFYNFPVGWATQDTGTVGLLEPGVGTALPSDATKTFQELLNEYRRTAGIDTDGHFYVQNSAGQYYDNSAGERSLDVGVVTSAAPGSTIGLYVGSGQNGNSYFSSFTGYQQAFWDLLHNPGVISSSFGDLQMPNPDSPFYEATSQLFVDAMLRNISVFSANGDGGSGDQVGNGITNQYTTYTSPYGVLVGGTSLETPDMANHDTTVREIVEQVAAGNLATIWQLVSGGMVGLPTDPTSVDTTFIETVWNSYYLAGAMLNPGYYVNNAGSGGADPTQPTPWYQLAYGLTPFTADPLHEQGRGTPDVSALAGGSIDYKVPGQTMAGIWDDYGTSAATPFWASLTAHLNAELSAIGLPRLGYANDLLYMAAVATPAAFNDITLGNNISSFAEGGSIVSQSYGSPLPITPTGFGDHAGPGYDLATGLGTPNALLLARGLSAIATAQYYFDTPDVLTDTSGGWTSTIDQSLLFQSMLSSNATIGLDLGGHDISFAGAAGGAYAWTSQFAQQSLQADFSSELVTMYDRYAQGTVVDAHAAAGAGLSVVIGGTATGTPQATLSSAGGFVDFVSDATDSAVQVARAVAVAQTAEGANDQDVVVRLRQNGMNDISVLFYKVDDYSGTVSGLQPGQAGYDAASLAHAYKTTAGGDWIHGPGYGAFAQTELADVDAGDLIAMRITNGTDTFWAFSGANETVDGQHVGHIWNYGLNTWGWEDLYGGGDHDFNDLVVQLDFTSAAGTGFLV
ncbi:DUF4114 domain-containing protein [Aquabacter sp. CN5-332]|uniref:DUF4114 domain-containing protein n=1 Tax=Aquabacter sp. CN5-332 TaxID=3156608 RepID=UPI0032B5BCCA